MGLLYLACVIVCTGYGITFPLLASLVYDTGVSGTWVGINAALPALGWILGAMLVPVLQLKRTLSIKSIASGFLVLACIGILIPLASTSYAALCVTRFVFGGAIGVFLRCVEYALVAEAKDDKRGGVLGIYGAMFLTGMIIGSLVQPAIAGEIGLSVAVVLGLFCVGFVLFARVLPTDVVTTDHEPASLDWSVFGVFPIAFIGVLAYALFESVPAYFLQIHALESGNDEATAAYTLAAAALGTLVFMYPVLALSDKIGRVKTLLMTSILAIVVSVAVPSIVDLRNLYLAGIFVLGATAGLSYMMCLAMLGDKFSGASLILANALFGVVYAGGSVIGPLLHGGAIEIFGPDGVFYSVTFIFLCLACFAAVFRDRPIRKLS